MRKLSVTLMNANNMHYSYEHTDGSVFNRGNLAAILSMRCSVYNCEVTNF